jgi:hypothetical protein
MSRRGRHGLRGRRGKRGTQLRDLRLTGNRSIAADAADIACGAVVSELLRLGHAPSCCIHCHQLMIDQGKHECGKRGVTVTDLFELYFASE